MAEVIAANDIRRQSLAGRLVWPLRRVPRLLDPIAERIFGRQLWAVASTALSSMLRQPATILLLVATAAFVVWLPDIQMQDDTLSNRVQQFLSFSLAAITYLGAFLVLLLAASMIVSDIDSKVAQMALVKPISRSTYVLGKWLAMLLLTGLIIFGGGLLVYVRLQVMLPPKSELVAEDGRYYSADALRLYEQVLVARGQQVWVPNQKEVEQQIDANIERLVREGSQQVMFDFDPSVSNSATAGLRENMRLQVEAQMYSVNPGERAVFVFENVRVSDQLRTFQIRFQAEVNHTPPGDESLPLIWRIGDRTKGTPVYTVSTRERVRGPATFSVNRDAIASDGTLRVEVHNLQAGELYVFNNHQLQSGAEGWQFRQDENGRLFALFSPTNTVYVAGPNGQLLEIRDGELVQPEQDLLLYGQEFETVMSFPKKRNALQILYHAGSFEPNFIRGLFMLWSFLVLLGSLGLAFSALVSFPVAVLCSLVSFIVVLLVPYIRTSMSWMADDAAEHPLFWIAHNVARVVLLVTPDLTNFAPIDDLADGLFLTWGLTGWTLLQLVLLAGGVLFALAAIGLSRREIALPSNA